ncbi:helix-turn-helix domain-containing protein [Achromobacter xylosoxidans]|uniref:helix-turn-helix domain-containing protein n=1 Tax=Alcaligenes xylosoxydans xylosoxydans TaxID=85698 RepID=UPI001F0F93BF|nr:helix-turn-helix domain-containing protein [Achromobacter xylosoxidans]MCH4572244.1 helix-turn-helix domain-containing protein [Achromobacter xylosoxidans]
MGRPSKLTEAQWEVIGKRLLAGESTSALAREFGVSKGAISTRFSKRTETIKAVANQLVAADRAMANLNVSEQIAARSLADDLKAVSEHLAGAARYGSATAHRLLGVAHGKVAQIDDADPLNAASVEAMKGIAAMTRLANESSEIAVNLLRANKDNIEDLNRGGKDVPAGLDHFYGASAVSTDA